MPTAIFIIIAFLNGGWMLFDGIHVLLKGKYFGPPEPGPWSHIVARAGMDPFSFGPVFLALGIAWLLAAIAVMQGLGWGWPLGIIVAVCTLWYAPVGTLTSLLAIGVLWFFRDGFGQA